jgi:hypothetical protein
MSTDPTIQWFGIGWGAPINVIAQHIQTPIGALCFRCQIPIVLGDRGYLLPPNQEAWHLGCFLGNLLGDDAPSVIAEREERCRVFVDTYALEELRSKL